VAQRHVIAERYKEWEITGPPEIRGDGEQGYFRPYPPPAQKPIGNVQREPGLDKDERYFVLLFLRRYVTWCARRRRFAQMQGAAQLFTGVRSSYGEPECDRIPQ
jgi:hypothetical protein